MNANQIVKNAVTRDVVSYTGNQLIGAQKSIVEEVSYRMYVNGESVGDMTCSPWEEKEAVIGYLFMKEYISGISDVTEIKIAKDEQKVRVQIAKQLACPGNTFDAEILSGTKAAWERKTRQRMSVREVIALSRKLEEKSGLFHRTGGVHCAALVKNGRFLSYKEDVSRHVAVDKVVGDCLLQKIPMQNGVLVFSGRVPAEILQKVAAMGCVMIIAKSAPTNYSCQLAQRLGITLIGFARDKRFNIYSHPERVYE